MSKTTREPTSTLGLLRSMRPKQWIKNVFLFAGIVFSGHLSDRALLTKAFGGFAIFCALSASAYLLNDTLDVKRDRNHPTKSLRPIAAGHVGKATAIFTAVLLTGGGLAVASQINPSFFAAAVAYFALTITYSFALKHIVLLDVIGLAMGYVLRAVAGAYAVSVVPSPWLILCTILVATFFGLTKRRHELITLGDDAIVTRPIFKNYSEALLDQLVSLVSSATLISYALYTFFAQQRRGHAILLFTFPTVLYALFRYLYLVYRKGLGGSPEDLFLSDIPLAASGVVWVATILAVIYWP